MREGQMLRSAVALLMMCGCAAAYVVGCHVEPVKSTWSGYTDSIWPYDGVSQTVTCNFDSLSYVEIFAGAKGDGGSYHVAVYDGSSVEMWSDGDSVPDQGWVRFQNWNRRVAYTKGKEYVFRFSRQAGSSPIQFYWDEDPYQYGQLIVGQQEYPDRDLACRVMGRMDTVGSYPWGATCFLPDDSADWGTWADSMKVSGATWGTFYVRWDTIERDSGTFDFGKFDDHVEYVADNADLDPVAVLIGTPKWASSRIDTFVVPLNDTTDTTIIEPTVFAPPLYMDTTPSVNPWLRYLDALLSHTVDTGLTQYRPSDRVHTWSIWNESNEGCDRWHKPDSWPGWTGWWRTPGENRDTSLFIDLRWSVCMLGHA